MSIKPFRQFIVEVETVRLSRKGGPFAMDNLAKGGDRIYDDELGFGGARHNMGYGKKVSTIGKDHDVYREKTWGNGVNYHIIHRKSKRAHVSIQGEEHKHRGKGTSAFEVNTLAAHKKSTIKAYEVYHHLLKHHHTHLISSDQQSDGGRKTWLALVKKKDVKNYAWKPHPVRYELKHGKPWNVDIAKKGTTLTHSKAGEADLTWSGKDEHGKADVRIVAHRGKK